MRANAALCMVLVSLMWPHNAVSEGTQTPSEICLDYKAQVAAAATSEDRFRLIDQLLFKADEFWVGRQDIGSAIVLHNCRLGLIKQHDDPLGSPGIGIAHDIMGDAYFSGGHLPEAIAQYRLAIATFEKLENGETFVASAMMKLGRVLADAGRRDEAEEQMTLTVARMAALFGPDDELTQIAQQKLEDYQATTRTKQE